MRIKSYIILFTAAAVSAAPLPNGDASQGASKGTLKATAISTATEASLPFGVGDSAVRQGKTSDANDGVWEPESWPQLEETTKSAIEKEYDDTATEESDENSFGSDADFEEFAKNSKTASFDGKDVTKPAKSDFDNEDPETSESVEEPVSFDGEPVSGFPGGLKEPVSKPAESDNEDPETSESVEEPVSFDGEPVSAFRESKPAGFGAPADDAIDSLTEEQDAEASGIEDNDEQDLAGDQRYKDVIGTAQSVSVDSQSQNELFTEGDTEEEPIATKKKAKFDIGSTESEPFDTSSEDAPGIEGDSDEA